MDKEDWKWFRDEQKERNLKRRTMETKRILALEGVNVVKKTDYQFRINGMLDVYPTHKKFHNLKSTKRGSYTDLNKLIKEQIHGN